MSAVSAIMAVRNGANYLAEAIDSMLSQTVRPSEIIVVDDGSTDATAPIAAAYGGIVRVISKRPGGQGAALSEGVAAATGEYLAFNDHDDLWAARKLEHQLAAMTADPQLDAVFGLVEQFVTHELPEEIAAPLRPPVAVSAGELAQCMLVRKSYLLKVGNFVAAESGSAFLGWLGRAKIAGFRSEMLDEIVLRRRLHLTNYGRLSPQERDRNHLSALHRLIRARRQ